jgi:hypothetical protein
VEQAETDRGVERTWILEDFWAVDWGLLGLDRELG